MALDEDFWVEVCEGEGMNCEFCSIELGWVLPGSGEVLG